MKVLYPFFCQYFNLFHGDVCTQQVTGSLIIVIQPFIHFVQPAGDMHIGEAGKLHQCLVIGNR